MTTEKSLYIYFANDLSLCIFYGFLFAFTVEIASQVKSNIYAENFGDKRFLHSVFYTFFIFYVTHEIEYISKSCCLINAFYLDVKGKRANV